MEETEVITNANDDKAAAMDHRVDATIACDCNNHQERERWSTVKQVLVEKCCAIWMINCNYDTVHPESHNNHIDS